MVATFIITVILISEALFIGFYTLTCRIRDLENKVDNLGIKEDKVSDYRNEKGLFSNKKR
jgi:hypothetical protein